MPSFKAEYGLTHLSSLAQSNLSANLVSVMQAGAVAGALLANPLADKLGRKPALLIVSVIAFIGGILQGVAFGHLACFYVGRFVEGLGLGGATMVAPTYVSENAPRSIRGLLIGFYQLFETMGAMVAFWINYGSLLHLKGHAQFIVPLCMQALPPFLLFCSMVFCPESPRFLAKQDNWDGASRTLSTVRNLPVDHPYVQAELHEMQAQLEEDRASVHGTGFWAIQKDCWLVPGNRNRALLSIGLMICQQMTGTNALNYYAPTIFSNLGITGNAQSLFATGVYGIVKMTSCGIFILFLADTLGRRWSLMWTGAFMSLVMFYLGFYIRFDPPIKGASVPPAGYVALVAIYLFAAAFQFGWGPVCWIYVSEIPTARLRGLNVALSAATQWIFNLVIARSTPVMLQTVGAHGYGTYFIFACFNACIVVVTILFVKETKGISLERMDELFGVATFENVEELGKAATEGRSKRMEIERSEGRAEQIESSHSK